MTKIKGGGEVAVKRVIVKKAKLASGSLKLSEFGVFRTKREELLKLDSLEALAATSDLLGGVLTGTWALP